MMDSESSYYPVERGYTGKAMLLNTLNELAHGVQFEKVLERYGLKRKGKSLNIIDKRKRAIHRMRALNELQEKARQS
jgi:hypothetical protein